MNWNRILLFAAAILVMSGCAVDDIDSNMGLPDNGKKPVQQIVIHGTESDQVVDDSSRAIHGTEEDETSFSWQAGVDKIGVLVKYVDEYDTWWTGEHHRFVNSADGDVAMFEYSYDVDAFIDPLELSVGQTIVAYYPYGTAMNYYYDSSRPILRNSLGALLQNGDNNTEHLYHGDYMFALPITLAEEHFDSENNVKLNMEFGHIFSKMRFAIKNSTNRTLDIHSLVYRSTKEDDVMQGTLYLDAETGEFITPEYYEWGDIQPSNSSVLEVENVTLAPNESATLWMWMMPLDFTESNADGRKADIMVNTSAGVFRVQNTNFNTQFVAGNVYRQGFELTEAKLLEDYAYVSDPNFVRILYMGDENSWYDEETGEFKGRSFCPLYDIDLQPLGDLNEETMWDKQFKTGCYMKISEAASLEEMNIEITEVNALSLDGLQYFTGLKLLNMMLGSDMNNVMTLRALKLSTLVNLEELFVLQAQIPQLDLSKNTKLEVVMLNQMSKLEKIIGLDKLENLTTLGLNQLPSGANIDLSVCPTLKEVEIMADRHMGSLNLSGLNLEKLSLDMPNIEVLNSANLSCRELHNTSGQAFPSGAPSGVKLLSLSSPVEGAESMNTQFEQMYEIEEMHLGGNIPNWTFTPAQASVKQLYIYPDENNTEIPTQWSNLTGVEYLCINKSSLQGRWCFDELDLSGMTSLTEADILVRELHVLKAPASLKRLDVAMDSSIAFNPPAALEDVTINSIRGEINIGSGAGIKHLYLIGEAGSRTDVAISMGEYPLLEDVIIDVDLGLVEFNATSYPLLKSYRLANGKQITSIPSSQMLPQLESLYISSNTGVSSLDLRGYANLKELSVYESNFSNGAIKITSAQRDYAQANAASNAFTGITATTVSSIYAVE